jgi:hypothetical protein
VRAARTLIGVAVKLSVAGPECRPRRAAHQQRAGFRRAALQIERAHPGLHELLAQFVEIRTAEAIENAKTLTEFGVGAWRILAQ